MDRYPRMLFRRGKMLPEHGADYLIVADADEEAAALRNGWQIGLEFADAEPVKPAFAKFDRNGDGLPGGSLPAAERGLDDLKAEALALGIKVDRRWGESRLIREIAAAKAGE